MASVLRNAIIDDLPRIVEIYNEAIPGRKSAADYYPVTADSRRQWFEEHDPRHFPLWVLEKDGKIVAWVGLQAFRNRPAYHSTAEFSIYVDSLHQNEGIGSFLLESIIEECPKLHIDVLIGLIFSHNEPSLRLVKKMGFKKWGCLYGVTEFEGNKKDVVIVGLRVNKNSE